MDHHLVKIANMSLIFICLKYYFEQINKLFFKKSHFFVPVFYIDILQMETTGGEAAEFEQNAE